MQIFVIGVYNDRCSVAAFAPPPARDTQYRIAKWRAVKPRKKNKHNTEAS